MVESDKNVAPERAEKIAGRFFLHGVEIESAV